MIRRHVSGSSVRPSVRPSSENTTMCSSVLHGLQTRLSSTSPRPPTSTYVHWLHFDICLVSQWLLLGRRILRSCMGPFVTRQAGRQAAERNNANSFWNHMPNPTPMASVLSHIAPPAVRRTELSANFIHNFQRKPHVPVHQDIFNHLVCHPASQYGPSTRLLPQKTSGDLLGRLMFQLTPRWSMTQLFACLVPTCPDGSGAF